MIQRYDLIAEWKNTETISACDIYGQMAPCKRASPEMEPAIWFCVITYKCYINILCICSIPLPLFLRGRLLLHLFFLNETPILTIIKTDNTLDEVMIRELFVRFRRVLNSDLPVKYEARLCSPALPLSISRFSAG
jgi:hypothetical protein